MRIALICPPWLAVPPKGYGGIEWVVALEADGLAEVGHDVTLFATGDSITKAKLEYVYEVAPGSKAINDVMLDTTHTLFSLRDARERFEVLHVHSPFSALAASIETGVPTVHTLHGSFTPEMIRLYDLVGDRAWFVAISEAQKRFHESLQYAGVVYNGIDMAFYSFNTEKEDFVLFLGRAAPEKGWRRAIEAAKLAGETLVSAVKIAHPTEEEEWERNVKPIIPKDWTVMGEISQEEKVDLLRRAKAVLFPIDWPEPFGLVMTEAMACGTPVIATPRGSVPEVIEDGVTGWIVSVENYAVEAAEKLKRLDEIDPRACRERVQRLFSKEAMVAGYEGVFERVIADGRGGRDA
ncbi:MAG: glycosyltransferase family 4 protein [Actinobacteria bacterium]|nr:MAG: glycosyltransferase family 4 protein [Actinomycetota bacterium]